MCDLKGLWCFYIGQGGRQWQKSASTDPRWHTHTHTIYLPLFHSQPPPLLSPGFSYTLICMGKHMHAHKHALSLTNSHCYAWTHTRLDPSSPIPTPLVALLASVCVSCVEGHQDIPQPAPRVCSAAWNRLGFQHNCPHWTRTSDATLCHSWLADCGVMFDLNNSDNVPVNDRCHCVETQYDLRYFTTHTDDIYC